MSGNEQKKECFVCGTSAYFQYNHDRDMVFYACPVCGRYELGFSMINRGLNKNQLASFLLYNGYRASDFEYRYYTSLKKEVCDQYKEEYNSGNNTRGLPVHFDAEMIGNWYPKSFSEKMDRIIEYIGIHTSHPGQPVVLSYEATRSLLFIDRFDYLDDGVEYSRIIERNDNDCSEEMEFVLKHLKEENEISYSYGSDRERTCYITLMPLGFSRLTELQRHNSHGKNALVAMQFGEKTRDLRESIRRGIAEAGYNAIFIDEVEHNEFITPEILKYIRDSKFVVAELTHQNNGAYFEEGYAMGIGKPVIQLCKKDVKLHFDIAQKNTIIWETEDEIPQRLMNRIKATID